MEPNTQTFDGLGIAPGIRDVLTRLKFSTPTPIQRQSIPIAVEGKDVVGIAQTGTGKTLAFGIPMIQKLLSSDSRGLILVPTRELAIQVDETLCRVGGPLGIKTAVLIGGTSMGPQLRALSRNPNIVIATPGRLIDHLEQGTIRLTHVGIMVLDEADRMLDMGFLPQMKKIFAVVPKERQTMLFSATLSGEVMSIASSQMKIPTRIEIAPQGTTSDNVTQEIYVVPKGSKGPLLETILNEYRGPTLVFIRTKHGATRVARSLRALGHNAAEIHSNRTLGQRRDALEGFKSGKYRVLVATDIAARGIDVTGIELVINFDLPSQSADYVHRIGRTGRAGASGHAISFAEPNQRRDIRDIERLTKKVLTVSSLPGNLPQPTYTESREDARPQRSGRPFQRNNSGPFRPTRQRVFRRR